MTPEDNRKRDIGTPDLSHLNGTLVHIEKVPEGDHILYVLRLNNETVISLSQWDALANLRVGDSFELKPDIFEGKRYDGRTAISIAKSNKHWLTFIVPNACIHPPEES